MASKDAIDGCLDARSKIGNVQGCSNPLTRTQVIAEVAAHRVSVAMRAKVSGASDEVGGDLGPHTHEGQSAAGVRAATYEEKPGNR